MPINTGPSFGGSGMQVLPRDRMRRVNSSGGDTPGNLPYGQVDSSTGGRGNLPPNDGGMRRTSMSQQPRRMGGAGGMVDPNFRRMMDFKASGGMGSPIAQQFRGQHGPGAFGVSPSLYYQHFDRQGMPQQQQQPQQQQNPYGMMGFGGMNPFMGGMGMMNQGMVNTGPSDQMMRQLPFNMGSGFGGGIWNPVYQGGPDTSQMMGQMRNRGMGGGMMGGLFGRMGY